MTTDQTLIDQVARLRQEAEVSYRELASFIGLHEATVYSAMRFRAAKLRAKTRRRLEMAVPWLEAKAAEVKTQAAEAAS